MTSRRTKFVPLPGESLPSLLIRAAGTLGPFPQDVVHSLLGHPEHLASAATRVDLMEQFAEYLNVPPSELVPTMLLPDEKRPGHVRLGDFLFRSDQIRQTPIRLAFDTLRNDTHPYHRLIWAACALSGDPDSGAPLEDRCAFCSAHFVWSAAVALARCHDCGGEATRMPAKSTGPVDAKAEFCAKLLSSSVRVRGDFRSTLPEAVATWPEVDLLDLLDALASLRPSDAGISDAVYALHQGRGAMVALLASRLSEMRRSAPRLSDLVAFANLHVRISRLPSLRVKGLLSLVLEAL